MTACAFSIVTPVYQTEPFLVDLLTRIDRVMATIPGGYEIICVDDASPDHSWETLLSLREERKYPLRLIRLSHNHGQHKALLCGMSLAKGTEAVILIDADLQTPPEAIPLLIAQYREAGSQVVYGIAPARQQSSWRNWGSRLLGGLMVYFGDLPPQASSFKLIRRPLVDQLCGTTFDYIFLDAMIGWFTRDISFVQVEHHSRPSGRSGYGFSRLSIMAMKIIINYTALPLRLMTYSGLLVSVVCFGLGIYFLINRIFFDVQLGFSAIAVLVSFGFSLILFCLGIIGEYIRRMYFAQFAKPAFSVQEIVT